MDLAGLLMILAGIWILDSVIKNRPPMQTLKGIAANPSAAKSVITNANGTGDPMPVVTAPVVAATAPADGTSGGWALALSSTSTTGAGGAAQAIAFARSHIGDRYVWGGNGPTSWDCSGLVSAAWASAGKTIPRTTATMLLSPTLATVRDRASLQAGDLLFPYPGHVGIVTGSGTFVDAKGVAYGVVEEPVTSFFQARRVI